MRLLIPLAIAILALAAGAYVFLRPQGAGDTVAVTRGKAVRVVYATGVVEPVEWAMLSADKTRRVVRIIRDEGESVREGDPLAQLDDSVEEAQLNEARARLEFARAELERKQRLLKSGATTRRNVDDAQREYEEAQARVASIEHERGRLVLTAPLNGMVLRREAEPGETVQAGEAVLWVGKPLPLRITAEVDEEDIGQVALGQEALIKADAFPGRALSGKVAEITPKGDPVNKVFRVRIGLPDDTPLKIGMTTEVNIVAETVENALLIPVESERGGKVWTPRGKPVEIKTGIRGETQIQVLEGLAEGDAILRAPPADAKP